MLDRRAESDGLPFALLPESMNLSRALFAEIKEQAGEPEVNAFFRRIGEAAKQYRETAGRGHGWRLFAATCSSSWSGRSCPSLRRGRTTVL